MSEIASEPRKEVEETQERVSFRELVPQIPSTTYASHGMYYYPARFIPQVVRWAIESFTSPGEWVLDPFAGSGTVCVECLITGRNSASLDLSPMLRYLVDAKTCVGVDWNDLRSDAANITSSGWRFAPGWSKIAYWHPHEFYSILSEMWGGYHKSPHPLSLIALLRTTKRFSYADDQVPKLFKSKRKTKQVQEMLSQDYRNEMRRYFLKALDDAYQKSKAFEALKMGGKAIVKAGVDLLTYDIEGRFDLVLTSPPYGIAHEYIRSVKLELAWLGFTDIEIRELTSREIPYGGAPLVAEINSPTFHRIIERVKPRMQAYCRRYFASVLFGLGKALNRLVIGGHAAIFIGNATFSGVEMPFSTIFTEHFESRGYEFVRLLHDEIKARRLFQGRLNPSPNGITAERLLVLRKSDRGNLR